MRKHGAMVASKLSKIAQRSLDSEIVLDLRHWSRAGRRGETRLSRRGATALHAAAERNRERTEPEKAAGRLRTVSDGADQMRMTLDDGSNLQMSVDASQGVLLGPLLGKRVEVEMEVTVRWQLASGRETRSRSLVRARLAEDQPELAYDSPID